MTDVSYKISKRINHILKYSSASAEDVKALLRWSKTLSSVYLKEIKTKKHDDEFLSLIYSYCEVIGIELCSVDGEELEFFGPSILEALIRIREVREMKEKLVELEEAAALKEGNDFILNVSEEQLNKMRNISLISQAAQ